MYFAPFRCSLLNLGVYSIALPSLGASLALVFVDVRFSFGIDDVLWWSRVGGGSSGSTGKATTATEKRGVTYNLFAFLHFERVTDCEEGGK